MYKTVASSGRDNLIPELLDILEGVFANIPDLLLDNSDTAEESHALLGLVDRELSKLYMQSCRDPDEFPYVNDREPFAQQLWKNHGAVAVRHTETMADGVFFERWDSDDPLELLYLGDIRKEADMEADDPYSLEFPNHPGTILVGHRKVPCGSASASKLNDLAWTPELNAKWENFKEAYFPERRLSPKDRTGMLQELSDILYTYARNRRRDIVLGHGATDVKEVNGRLYCVFGNIHRVKPGTQLSFHYGSKSYWLRAPKESQKYLQQLFVEVGHFSIHQLTQHLNGTLPQHKESFKLHLDVLNSISPHTLETFSFMYASSIQDYLGLKGPIRPATL